MGVNGTHNTVGENVGAYNTICVKVVPVDRQLLGVDELRNATQKHCCSNDVLASLSELWEIVPLVHDVMLDLSGMTLGATHRVMRIVRNVLHRACRRRRLLVLPPLS